MNHIENSQYSFIENTDFRDLWVLLINYEKNKFLKQVWNCLQNWLYEVLNCDFHKIQGTYKIEIDIEKIGIIKFALVLRNNYLNINDNDIYICQKWKKIFLNNIKIKHWIVNLSKKLYFYWEWENIYFDEELPF